MENKREVFIRMLKEICNELDYKIELFSQNWIIKISNKFSTNFIIAHSFGINNDASSKICADKVATSEILTSSNIPNVSHILFHIYDNYHNDNGNWIRMIDFFNANNKKVVIKPNVGSGGIGVTFVDTLYKLEKETYKILNCKSAICLSPFEDIEDEFRLIMLNNKPQLIFKKTKPKVIGNGRDSILTLLTVRNDFDNIPTQILENLKEQKVNLKTVLNNNEIFELNWKHNLGSGAIPEIINEIDIKLIELAQKAIIALEMSFCSVDIIKTRNNSYKVMEVNSGVMLTNFILHNEQDYLLAKNIYKKAIIEMMIY